MKQITAAGVALLTFHTTSAFADTARGDEAFAQGYYFTASREWRDSANAGEAAAMLNLGALYDLGHGTPQDFREALSWYRRAAEAGNAAAMFDVGAMYDNGRGTGVDRAEAIKWYAMAAKNGNGRAAYAAATMYRDGNGVPQDTANAIKFFRIAAAAGIGAARANLATLEQGSAAKNQSAPAKNLAASPRFPAPPVPQFGAADAAPPPAVLQPAPPTRSAAIDAAPAVMTPTRPALLAAPAPLVSPAPLADASARTATARTASEAAANAEATPPPEVPKPSGPRAVQLTSLDALTAGVESFHKAALQRGSVSPAMSEQYAEAGRDITHRAATGGPAIRYDAAYAYEHGVGLAADPVRSYVFYILATLSPDASVKSAALKGAFEVGGRLSDAQHAAAADMLVRGIP